MSERAEKSNRISLPGKPLTVAVCAVALAVVVTALCLFLKGPFYMKKAFKAAEQNEFSRALSYTGSVSNEKAKALTDYLELRLEINRTYPDLLADFDYAAISDWNVRAKELQTKSDLFTDKINADVSGITEKLGLICTLYDEYNSSIRSEVLDMMDIFGEINRLYSAGSDGNNITFTVAEVNGKVDGWEKQCNEINGYMMKIPGGMDIYLLSYLVSETRGECSDLREAMNGILDKGYSETDTVRVSGSGKKVFPAIRNSGGDSVSVSEKDRYEQFMFRSICKALSENLSEFYTGM